MAAIIARLESDLTAARAEAGKSVSPPVLVGLLCPECQTPEENAEAEVEAAALDYANTAPDADGRPKTAPVGDWHTVTAMGHPLVQRGRKVHLALAVEAAKLRVAVGPQSSPSAPLAYSTSAHRCLVGLRQRGS
ncbi:hypothetical protein [Streptomyces longispororuber]|uniref:hypothetical protein n=1 Tax=Streptomyces longispororuber TaxID=68230 RepID=UPI0036F9A139